MVLCYKYSYCPTNKAPADIRWSCFFSSTVVVLTTVSPQRNSPLSIWYSLNTNLYSCVCVWGCRICQLLYGNRIYFVNNPITIKRDASFPLHSFTASSYFLFFSLRKIWGFCLVLYIISQRVYHFIEKAVQFGYSS